MTQPHQISRNRKIKTPVQLKAAQEISAIDHRGRAHAPVCCAHVLAAFHRKEDFLPSPPGPKDGVPAVGQQRRHPK